MIIVILIIKAMQQLDCKLYRGEIYCKPKQAQLAYVFHKGVEGFLNTLTANKHLAEDLLGNIPSLVNILSNDDCAVVPQLKIDLNLIEVLPEGICFNIEEKRFVCF